MKHEFDKLHPLCPCEVFCDLVLYFYVMFYLMDPGNFDSTSFCAQYSFLHKPNFRYSDCSRITRHNCSSLGHSSFGVRVIVFSFLKLIMPLFLLVFIFACSSILCLYFSCILLQNCYFCNFFEGWIGISLNWVFFLLFNTFSFPQLIR